MRESTKQYKFEAGEKVLCFHGPLLYKAKCLEHRVKDSKIEYYVHYDGWNKSWDEWVPEARVEKLTEHNVSHMKNLQKAHKLDKSGKGKNRSRSKQAGTSRDSKPQSLDTSSCDPDSRSSTPVADSKKRARGDKRRSSPTPSYESGSDAPKRNKRIKPDHAVETEDQFLDRVEVKINIPAEIKTWLANESIWIVKLKKLVSLPAKINVTKILDMYIESKKSKISDGMLTSCSLICDGIKEYFDSMLPARLLYKEERPQNVRIMAEYPNSEPSDIYGCHHLLRLFIKMGEALAYTRLNEKTMAHTCASFYDFLRFIANNASTFMDDKNYE